MSRNRGKSSSPADLPREPFEKVVAIMQRLLGPKGCPWDKEQTLQKLKPYLIEEAYEVLEAMDSRNPADHCDELGDLLFQIVFQSALREKQGDFNIEDVCNAISDKLVRRHPHVFGDLQVSGSAEVLQNWERIKAQERGGQGRTLGSIPRALPALARAMRVSEKARRAGFDWPTPEGAYEKVQEELGELARAVRQRSKAAMSEELGDLLFSLVSYAQKLELDPEEALRQTIDRFTARFEFIEDGLAARGKHPTSSTLAEMDALWNEAKRTLATSHTRGPRPIPPPRKRSKKRQNPKSR